MISNVVSTTSRLLANIVDEIPGTYIPQDDLETAVTAFSFRTVLISSVALIALTIAAMQLANRFPKTKVPLFGAMLITILAGTFVLIGSTVYLNTRADSGGPAHWHADFEIWACGNEIELRDPTGFSNKIGTWTLHEHNDHRIHLEGVVVDEKIDASIGKFMYVIGGTITDDALIVPINPDLAQLFEDEADGDGPSSPYPDLVYPYVVSDGDRGEFVRFQSSQMCGDQEAEVQTFVYHYNEEDKTYEQFKVDSPETLEAFGIEKVNEYSISDDPNVPPGDCIIFEFDVAKDKTDKLCEQYGVRDVVRCTEFGVEESKRAICESTQLNYVPGADYRSVDPNEEALDPSNTESEEG